LAAGTKRPELDDGMMNKGDWTGTKKSKKVHEYQVGGGVGLSRSRKRPYEYGEHEYDVSMEKLYKCNYWEDPAYAKKIEFFGLGLARNAALDNECERLYRVFEVQYPNRTKHTDMSS
jgi:hypothetical protein